MYFDFISCTVWHLCSLLCQKLICSNTLIIAIKPSIYKRVTAIVTSIFVLLHVWALRIGHVIYGFEINYQAVSTHFADPVVFWLYVVGIIASMYHFGNGLSTLPLAGNSNWTTCTKDSGLAGNFSIHYSFPGRGRPLLAFT